MNNMNSMDVDSPQNYNDNNYEQDKDVFYMQMSFKDCGEIISCGDGIARVIGIDQVKTNELVLINGHIPALAMNLESQQVGIVLFGSDHLVGQGDILERTFSVINIQLTTDVCGRIIDSLGNAIDGLMKINEKQHGMEVISNLSTMDEDTITSDYDQEEDSFDVNNDINDEITSEDINNIDEDWIEDDLEAYEDNLSNLNIDNTEIDEDYDETIDEIVDNDLFYSLEHNITQWFDKLISEIDIKAPGIIYRHPVAEPMYTGIKIVDSIIPVGKGQRELIIGDRQTGKTAIAIDTIINQSNLLQKSIGHGGAMCIYAAIGQKRSTVSQIYQKLKKFNAINATIIVAATASDTAAMQFLAPYSACTFAEYFNSMYQMDALVIYDDLSKQAVAYRQVSLLLRRPPGREAYPGDIFYLHSRLLERAVKLRTGSSSTALPIVETLEGDVSAFIPTNVISITDGQIFLEKELMNRGIMPAINVGLSVSRVGSNAQMPVMKSIAGQLKLKLAQFREVEAFLSFAGDLDETTLHTLNQGIRLVETLKQSQYSPIGPKKLVLWIFAGLNGFLDTISLDQVVSYLKTISSIYFYIEKNLKSELYKTIPLYQVGISWYTIDKAIIQSLGGSIENQDVQ